MTVELDINDVGQCDSSESDNCVEYLKPDDGLYCEHCYQKVVDELEEAKGEIEELRSHIAELELELKEKE
jgi:hypothetical protein